ncbi:MAG: PrgI family protein [Patescibacteria group bacterium]|nr:PrgI family protein [Patescibacteria group bacterium]
MQYQVPQFIEVEDKIFGPLTFKQFAYLAGAGGACLIFFTFLPWWLALWPSLPFVALGIALSFYKVNGRPFINALEHAIGYFFGNKLYLWKQREVKPTAEAVVPSSISSTLPKISESKLKDLAWSLNIKDRSKLGITTAQRTGFEI